MTGVLAVSNQRLFNNYIPEKIIKDENRQWWAFSNIEIEENPTIRLFQRWNNGPATPLIVCLGLFILYLAIKWCDSPKKTHDGLKAKE
jgi:hypothetical protein